MRVVQADVEKYNLTQNFGEHIERDFLGLLSLYDTMQRHGARRANTITYCTTI